MIFSDFDVVEPDLLLIRAGRAKTLIKDWVRGAPDLMVEILSRSTEEIDCTQKMKLYEKYGVLEYCIVDPEVESVEVYVLRKNSFKMFSRAHKGQRAKSEVLKGLVCDTQSVFKMS